MNMTGDPVNSMGLALVILRRVSYLVVTQNFRSTVADLFGNEWVSGKVPLESDGEG
jgi:hypothetical protein